MNILNRGQFPTLGAGLRDRIGNAYEQLAGDNNYQKNEKDLRQKTPIISTHHAT